MKKQKQVKLPGKFATGNAAAKAAAQLLALHGLAGPLLPPRLVDLVSVFLCNTSHLHGAGYHRQLRFALKQLAAMFGSLPISRVSSHDIRRVIVSNQRWGPRTRKHMLACIRAFFNWARAEGHLPRHLPTAAELVNLHANILRDSFMAYRLALTGGPVKKASKAGLSESLARNSLRRRHKSS